MIVGLGKKLVCTVGLTTLDSGDGTSLIDGDGINVGTTERFRLDGTYDEAAGDDIGFILGKSEENLDEEILGIMVGNWLRFTIGMVVAGVDISNNGTFEGL